MLGELIGGALGALGSILGGNAAEKGKKAEIAYQKEFAKQGVRWRVEDARAAGIHPAIAMGASVPSYTPVGLGSGTAEGLAGASQAIGGAISRTMTAPERVDAFTQQTQALTLSRMGLENELLATEIANAKRQFAGPAFPLAVGDAGVVPGQGDAVIVPTPFGLPGLKVANPDLAQTSQNHFGEPLEWLYGIGNWVDSLARTITGKGPPGPLPERETHEQYYERMRKNPMY